MYEWVLDTNKLENHCSKSKDGSKENNKAKKGLDFFNEII